MRTLSMHNISRESEEISREVGPAHSKQASSRGTFITARPQDWLHVGAAWFGKGLNRGVCLGRQTHPPGKGRAAPPFASCPGDRSRAAPHIARSLPPSCLLISSGCPQHFPKEGPGRQQARGPTLVGKYCCCLLQRAEDEEPRAMPEGEGDKVGLPPPPLLWPCRAVWRGHTLASGNLLPLSPPSLPPIANAPLTPSKGWGCQSNPSSMLLPTRVFR